MYRYNVVEGVCQSSGEIFGCSFIGTQSDDKTSDYLSCMGIEWQIEQDRRYRLLKAKQTERWERGSK